MTPKISVIMSVLNGEKFLREAVESILFQTYSDFEFIVIDDGSTDKTREIILSYDDSRIRLHHQINKGLTRSLNIGLKLAYGPYIARQDADDISDLNRLLYQKNFLDKNCKVGLVGSYAAFIDEYGNEIGIWKTPETHGQIKKTFLSGNSFCHGSVMFRSECVEKVGVYREKLRYAQDYDYWTRFAEHYNTANIPKILYKNRRTSNTISRKMLSKQLNYHLLVQQLMIERQNTGHDSLYNIDTSDLKAVLLNKFGIKKSEFNKFKSKIFFRKYSESLKTKNRMAALGFGIKSIILYPSIGKIRLIFNQLIRNAETSG
jgi:glycosyltransferase involved in cell wall biosynthesis